MAADPATIAGNETQIHQMMLNLCSNAAHAIGGRAGRIDVSLRLAQIGDGGGPLPLLRPGAYAHVTVADDGVGMDEATRRRIFEPFFTTKGVGEGTGLGLAIVHGVVIGHEGVIDVRSKAGQGTQFDIFFPLAEGSAVA